MSAVKSDHEPMNLERAVPRNVVVADFDEAVGQADEETVAALRGDIQAYLDEAFSKFADDSWASHDSVRVTSMMVDVLVTRDDPTRAFIRIGEMAFVEPLVVIEEAA